MGSTGEAARGLVLTTCLPSYILVLVVSDAELLYAWRAGDEGSGQELFKRYYRPVSRFFSNKVVDSPGDLVQETFMACVKGRDRVRGGETFRSYMFGVAYKVFTGYLRQQYRLPDELGSVSVQDLDPGPRSVMEQSEQSQLLLQALRRLPVEQQVIVELRYWEQMSSVDISHVLEVPAGTIRDRLRKGRQQLHEALRELCSDPKLLESTSSDIEGWAQKIRERLGH